jgi:high-affinity iron transporter
MFFVLFRETMEAAVIVSVLLTFVGRMSFPGISSDKVTNLQKQLKRMIWFGTAVGLGSTLGLGAIVIAVFYIFGNNLWEGAELLWEAVFGTIAVFAITFTAFAMLKSHELSEKLSRKLAAKIRAQNVSQDTIVTDADSEEFLIEEEKLEKVGSSIMLVFLWIPLLTVLREGLEAMVFLGGVAISEPPTAIPAAAIAGLLGGLFVGYLVHLGGSKVALHWFFVISSYFLFLVAAGLLSRAEGLFEDYFWAKHVPIDPDAADTVFFDPRVNVWMLPCCKRTQSGWSVFSALLGWRDVATIGTITIYCCYWMLVSVTLVFMRLKKNEMAKQESVSQITEAIDN